MDVCIEESLVLHPRFRCLFHDTLHVHHHLLRCGHPISSEKSYGIAIAALWDEHMNYVT